MDDQSQPQQQQQQPLHDEVGASAAPAAPPASSPPPSGAARVRCFSAETPSDGRLDFQIVDLGGGGGDGPTGALYVWVGVGAPKLGSLSLSVESRAAGATPATATLVRGPASATGTALGQRLAMRLKRPVLCACNIPADAALLQAFAERRLLQELLAMAQGPQQNDAGGGGGVSGSEPLPTSNGNVAAAR